MLQSPLKDYLAARLWVSFDGGEWGDTTAAGMRAVIDDMARYSPEQKPDLYFLAGYAMGQGIEAVLSKAVELGDLSRGGIVRASQAIGSVDYQQMMGAYRYGAPEDREPPRMTNIYRPDPANPMGLSAVRKGYAHPGAAAVTFTRVQR
jgi:hypothetical protein